MAKLGETLRRERVRRGLALKDIEQTLHISEEYLIAIEEDNYSVIPGNVYVKGFIRNYAEFLGLNGQNFVDDYKRSIGEPIIHNVKTYNKNKKRKKYSDEKMVHKKLSYEGRVKQRKKRIFKERLILGEFIFLIFLFILYLFFF